MNILVSIKKFLMNKNTVTIIGVILVIAILYFGYNYQLKQEITPINNIPIAKTTIQPRTLITKDMVDYISVVPSMLKSNVIRRADATNKIIIGQYSNYNTIIPAGSMFYKDTVVNQEELPNSAYIKIKEGEIPYSFPVSIASTYGNSMMPGDYIDIYMKAKDENGKLIVGKLIENIEILAVKDSTGKNVFENAAESRTPDLMIFGVEEEINILLRKASYMSEYSVVLFPVPHGIAADVTDENVTQVSTLQLKDFINSHTVVIEENEGEETEENKDEENKDNNEVTEG